MTDVYGFGRNLTYYLPDLMGECNETLLSCVKTIQNSIGNSSVMVFLKTVTVHYFMEECREKRSVVFLDCSAQNGKVYQVSLQLYQPSEIFLQKKYRLHVSRYNYLHYSVDQYKYKYKYKSFIATTDGYITIEY